MSNEISPAGTAGSASAEPGRQNEAASATATESPREYRSKRRTFTAEYKKAIVAEYDNAPLGSKGAVLRRERLYDSHVMEWRAALTAGLLDGPATRSKAGTPTRTGRPRNLLMKLPWWAGLVPADPPQLEGQVRSMTLCQVRYCLSHIQGGAPMFCVKLFSAPEHHKVSHPGSSQTGPSVDGAPTR